jgi:hypothetical protein
MRSSLSLISLGMPIFICNLREKVRAFFVKLHRRSRVFIAEGEIVEKLIHLRIQVCLMGFWIGY